MANIQKRMHLSFKGNGKWQNSASLEKYRTARIKRNAKAKQSRKVNR